MISNTLTSFAKFSKQIWNKMAKINIIDDENNDKRCVKTKNRVDY